MWFYHHSTMTQMCSPRAVGPELNVHFTFPLQCLGGFGCTTADHMYPHQSRTSTSHHPSILAWLPETSPLVGSQKQRQCMAIMWQNPEARSHAIHSPPSPRVAELWCTAQGCEHLCTVPGSWKLPSPCPCMACILTRLTRQLEMKSLLMFKFYMKDPRFRKLFRISSGESAVRSTKCKNGKCGPISVSVWCLDGRTCLCDLTSGKQLQYILNASCFPESVNFLR